MSERPGRPLRGGVQEEGGFGVRLPGQRGLGTAPQGGLCGEQRGALTFHAPRLSQLWSRKPSHHTDSETEVGTLGHAAEHRAGTGQAASTLPLKGRVRRESGQESAESLLPVLVQTISALLDVSWGGDRSDCGINVANLRDSWSQDPRRDSHLGAPPPPDQGRPLPGPHSLSPTQLPPQPCQPPIARWREESTHQALEPSSRSLARRGPASPRQRCLRGEREKRPAYGVVSPLYYFMHIHILI